MEKDVDDFIFEVIYFANTIAKCFDFLAFASRKQFRKKVCHILVLSMSAGNGHEHLLL